MTAPDYTDLCARLLEAAEEFGDEDFALAAAAIRAETARAEAAEAKLAEVERERDGLNAHIEGVAKDTHALLVTAEATVATLTAQVEAMRGAGLRFTGLLPTPFGDMVKIEGYPPETMMLVSVCGASGIKPVRCILWHQLYTKDLPALEAQGEVVICAVPYATDHFALTAALTTENQTNG